MAEPSDVSDLTDAELYRRYRQFTAELEGLMGYDPTAGASSGTK